MRDFASFHLHPDGKKLVLNIGENMFRVRWKLYIVTAALQNYKFVENLWEIYVSLLAVYVTLQLWQVHGVVAASTRKKLILEELPNSSEIENMGKIR